MYTQTHTQSSRAIILKVKGGGRKVFDLLSSSSSCCSVRSEVLERRRLIFATQLRVNHGLLGRRRGLNVSLQSVHVNRTVVFVPVFPLVVGGVAVFLLLHRPDPFLQLDQAGHLRGEVVLLASRRGRLVAAVLLVLVGHHLLDADHGLGLADQRHLRMAVEVGGEGMSSINQVDHH